MRTTAIARVVFREHSSPRSMAGLVLAFSLWLVAFDAVAPSVAEAGVHARERAVGAALATVGGLYAVFTGVTAFSGARRARRLALLRVRPVTPVAIVGGHVLGASVAVVAFAGVAGTIGLAWIASVPGDGSELVLYGTRSPTVVIQGERTIAARTRVRLEPGGEPLRLRFEGVDRLGEAGRLSLRPSIRHHPPEISLRVPVVVTLGASGREVPVFLHPRRTRHVSVRDADLTGGALDVEIRADRGASTLVSDPERLRVRSSREPYVASYAVVVGAAGLGLVLLLALSTALSTVLSPATGIAAALLAYALGHGRGFVDDLATGMTRLAHAPAEGGATSIGGLGMLAALDAAALRVMATVAPPFDALTRWNAITAREPVPLDGLLESLGWLALWVAAATGFAAWSTSRRWRA